MATKVRKADVWVVVLGGALALVLILPMLYTVSSSLKPLGEVLRVPIQWIPRTFRWQNFIEPLIYGSFARYIINSIVVATFVTAAELFFSSLAGYSLAKFDYRGRKMLFTGILAVMIVPVQVIIVPLAMITRALGMMDSLAGLIVPVALTPFGIFWMRQFFVTLPVDYIEAARVDGMGEFRIFRSIAMRMATPSLFALLIFAFMGNWNMYIWPLVVTRSDRLRTIPVGLVAFSDQYGTAYHHLFAMSVVAIIPTVFIFLAFRKKLLMGVAQIGLKG